jgi:hypothetical protein
VIDVSSIDQVFKVSVSLTIHRSGEGWGGKCCTMNQSIDISA